MAKSDAFFIRATVSTNGTTYAETAIDLGAYVDALGKSVLRIHNVAVRYGSATEEVVTGAATTTATAFQLSTQTGTAMDAFDDRALIASGRLLATGGGGGEIVMCNDSLDLGPQMWAHGYLVGVDTIYLGTDSSAATALVSEIGVVLECTVETLSQNAAMALALSQQ